MTLSQRKTTTSFFMSKCDVILFLMGDRLDTLMSAECFFMVIPNKCPRIWRNDWLSHHPIREAEELHQSQPTPQNKYEFAWKSVMKVETFVWAKVNAISRCNSSCEIITSEETRTYICSPDVSSYFSWTTSNPTLFTSAKRNDKRCM